MVPKFGLRRLVEKASACRQFEHAPAFGTFLRRLAGGDPALDFGLHFRRD
jgi:hypothetical protein